MALMLTLAVSYTGNGRIARIVAAAAAKHLTPLTLELGGKSPVYIDSDYDIELAAKRILFGKNTNAGQVCISPDFVLIHPSKQEALVSALKSHIASFHPSGALTDENYTKIVSPAHFSRLSSLLASTKGTVVIGGGKDEKTLKFETTVVTDVKEGDSLLSESVLTSTLQYYPFNPDCPSLGRYLGRSCPLCQFHPPKKQSTSSILGNII